jgi:hypothetical protein
MTQDERLAERKALRLPRCLRRGGMRAFGRGLDALCQTEVEGGTMAAWSSDEPPMPSMIPCTTWSGRRSTGAMCCKARDNSGCKSSLAILRSRRTSPVKRWT